MILGQLIQHTFETKSYPDLSNKSYEINGRWKTLMCFMII